MIYQVNAINQKGNQVLQNISNNKGIMGLFHIIYLQTSEVGESQSKQELVFGSRQQTMHSYSRKPYSDIERKL